jgi:RNA polymerase sigma factor (sigma-70 family)
MLQLRVADHTKLLHNQSNILHAWCNFIDKSVRCGDDVDHQDAFWIERAKRGDQVAFGLLVDKYSSGIVRFLAFKTGYVDEATDLAQETWLQAYLSLGRLHDPTKFQDWLYSIARNVALMWLRRMRMASAPLDTVIDETAIDEVRSAEDLVAAWELRNAVLHAIAHLSEVNREAVQLHYLHDLSYRQIAERLQVPVKTVKSRLHKARQQLKPELQSLFDEPSFPSMIVEEAMTEATIYDVYVVEQAQPEEPHAVVVLKAREQERYVPIWIGQPEAEGIAVKLRSLTYKRPLTYDLMTQLLERLGASVEAVRLSALRDQTFFATLRVVGNGNTAELDCRPSDALALAVRTNAPIFIADDVLAQAGRDQPGDKQAKGIKPLELELFKHVVGAFYTP